MIYVNTPCTPYDREVPNKSQFVDKTSVEAQGYIYGRREHNSRVSTGALLVSQIRLLLIHGATQTAHLRRVCNMTYYRKLSIR